jgi:hypothetical protein
VPVAFATKAQGIVNVSGAAALRQSTCVCPHCRTPCPDFEELQIHMLTVCRDALPEGW